MLHNNKSSVQFSSVAQSCLTLCNPTNHSMPGLPVYHQLPEFTQTHVHRVSDAIQPSYPLLSPSPPALNLSQHQSLFKWISSSLLLKSNADGFLTAIVFNQCSWNFLQLMFIESVMPSNHLILCPSLHLLPSVFPSIKVFSKESTLHIRWPKYWNFSFSISHSNEYSWLISFRMDWFDLF